MEKVPTLIPTVDTAMHLASSVGPTTSLSRRVHTRAHGIPPRARFTALEPAPARCQKCRELRIARRGLSPLPLAWSPRFSNLASLLDMLSRTATLHRTLPLAPGVTSNAISCGLSSSTSSRMAMHEDGATTRAAITLLGCRTSPILRPPQLSTMVVEASAATPLEAAPFRVFDLGMAM